MFKTVDHLKNKIISLINFIVESGEEDEAQGDMKAMDASYNVSISFLKLLRDLTSDEELSKLKEILMEDITEIFK